MIYAGDPSQIKYKQTNNQITNKFLTSLELLGNANLKNMPTIQDCKPVKLLLQISEKKQQRRRNCMYGKCLFVCFSSGITSLLSVVGK
jgi:hypothetical protein